MGKILLIFSLKPTASWLGLDSMSVQEEKEEEAKYIMLTFKEVTEAMLVPGQPPLFKRRQSRPHNFVLTRN